MNKNFLSNLLSKIKTKPPVAGPPKPPTKPAAPSYPGAQGYKPTAGPPKPPVSTIGAPAYRPPIPMGAGAEFTKLPQYYQVRKDDKNVADVGKKTGVAPQDLVSINKTKTLPPVGSYMQLQAQQYSNQYDTRTNPLAGQGGTPAPNRPGEMAAANTAAAQAGRGDASAQRLRDQAAVLQKQLQAGTDPNAIPASVVGFLRDKTGQIVTIPELLALGYVMNNQGVLVKGTAAQQAAAKTGGQGSPEFMNTGFMQKNLTNNVDFLNQLRYDPQKKRYVKIGTLIKQGKLDITKPGTQKVRGRNAKHGGIPGGARGGGGGPTPVPMATNREGPQTVLDIHLGSG